MNLRTAILAASAVGAAAYAVYRWQHAEQEKQRTRAELERRAALSIAECKTDIRARIASGEPVNAVERASVRMEDTAKSWLLEEARETFDDLDDVPDMIALDVATRRWQEEGIL